MKPLAGIGIYLAIMLIAALGLYELTAKSPAWLGTPLPGWQETNQTEHTTAWRQPTGILPLDKLLHEGREAVRFYGLLISG